MNEEKYSFYANFDINPLQTKNLDFNTFNTNNKINNNPTTCFITYCFHLLPP